MKRLSIILITLVVVGACAVLVWNKVRAGAGARRMQKQSKKGKGKKGPTPKRAVAKTAAAGTPGAAPSLPAGISPELARQLGAGLPPDWASSLKMPKR